MKKLLAFILAIGLGTLVIISLSHNEFFPEFGMADLSERVSIEYITKGSALDVIFGQTTNPESGPANIVTSIVIDYRSFDTLGEVTVLFISSLGIALLLGGAAIPKRLELNFKPNFMLKVGSRALFAIIIMTGVYIISHGHLTPGGGFPGGTMIASAFLLLYLADDQFRAKIKGFKILESIAGSLYVIIGLIGLILADQFLENFLPNGTVGALISSGILPVVYILIGLKVGSEISGIIDHFLTEEEVL
jgi:multicomponent Na+:H+ antiporter subunit B